MQIPFPHQPPYPLETGLLLQWPAQNWSGVTVMVGVSGGPDSVALLRAMHRIHRHHTRESSLGSLQILHFNHRWRAADADADENFVAELCGQLDLPCHIERAKSGAKTDEASARQERYEFYRDTAERIGARYVATGHTLNDQIETVLHRIIRGTGLAGLAGIRPHRPLSESVTATRPLLETTREQVMDYLLELEQPFRKDATNDDRRFTRTRLRNELLPLLADQYNPAVGSSLAKLGQLAGEAQDVIRQEVDRCLPGCLVRRSSHLVELDVTQLRKLSNFLCRELLATIWRQQAWPEQAMGFNEWTRLVQLATTNSRRTMQLPGMITADTTGHTLRIRRHTG